MRRLARAIDGLEEPAVEKIAQDQQEDPFQVLIATMLSAQTKDAVTASASERLFRVARTPRTMLTLPVKRIEELIYPVSFYRTKAIHVRQTCEQIMTRFGGKVPATMAELLTLPGVGRKTANLVLILAHRSASNICVDTHVHRISNRLGWTQTRTPEETERALYAVTRKKWWPLINLYLVTWGQNVCKPVYPLCNQCVLADLCPKLGVEKVGKGTMKGLGAMILAAMLLAAAPAAEQTSPGAGPVIVLETAKGTIEFETYPEEAPKTVARIVELVKKNFYNGQRFHRAEPKFVVQIGDPQTRNMQMIDWWGRSGFGKPIGVSEITKKRRHLRGAVAMGYAGTDPKQADSHFYIVLANRPDLDGRYTVFGRVISGLEVTDKIRKGDVLKKASVKE